MVGARRMEEYRESRTEATRFRRTFFLVARASLTGATGKLRASSCARGCRLPFAIPPSPSLSLSLLRSAKLFLLFFVLTKFPLTLHKIAYPRSHYATPRQNLFSLHSCFVSSNRAVQSLVSLCTEHASFLFELQFSPIFAANVP